MDVDLVGARILSAAALRMQRGMGRDRLRAAVADGTMIVAHRGWYVDAATWAGWFIEQRHAARAIATARAMREGDVVLSHTSAAVLWGLPLYRYHPQRVHVSGPTAHGVVAGRAVARHDLSVEGDRDAVSGIPVTGLARTVADLIGRLPLQSAVALADAALHLVAWDDSVRKYDDMAAELLRVEVGTRSALRNGARGVIQARWVLGFADGRAESTLESVSRLNLHLLGFAPPRLQVRVPHDCGYYDIDLGLDDVDVWAEVDGKAKYADAAQPDGADARAVVLAEKRREDDIRGRTGRRVIRWDADDLRDLEAFRRRLASFGVRPPGGPVVPPPTFSRGRP
ncbi:hypothetical protein G5T42_00925 [Microbacterium sp. 4R-513]|uniref:hypothetical protein n=1 Tax=Microbacterium sp. 4R-513 TaxID=2567934 RepID=UPI0013E18310|nr:hypothetical protein [Microbacterium sp. 4R-513]QIG38217.1 hypothetical protein G5T42_00925 [Microbacterium sp. 4R-513]